MATPALRLPSWLLYATAVAIWSTTWHAILYQLEHSTPEAGVALRFALAGALALAVAAWRGDRLRCSAREHALLALQGVFMYSLAYFAVYHAERHVTTGLVAVGYSAAPLINRLGAWLLWRLPLTPHFVAGGLICVAGVALIFQPEFARVTDVQATALGAALTVGAVLLSSVGNLAASRNAHHGLPFWSALGWGMGWGAALSILIVLFTGQSFTLPTASAWWVSLAYLSIAGSVIAFACFLALQERVGVGAASTIGVMTPVFALVVSTLFEGFQPSTLTWAGAALAVLGNVIILRWR